MAFDTRRAELGVFRRLTQEEQKGFRDAAAHNYQATHAEGDPFEIDPYHHPAYRIGAAHAILAQAAAELAALEG